jgi:hypothetical protein
MPDESQDAFVPIRDEDGRVTGDMDRTTFAPAVDQDVDQV